MALAALATLAPAQAVTFASRNGGNFANCGPLGGPLVNHGFSTTAPVHDSLSVSDPGGAGLPASAVTAQFDSVATPSGISLAVAGTATRTAPAGAVWSVADGRDSWQITITAPTRFALQASLSASSTEANVPTQHFTFAGSGLVPDPGSPLPPYQHSLNAPGSFSLAATGTLMPDTYIITFFGRAEGTTFPFTGSYSHSLSITFQHGATAVTRQALGNPNSYTSAPPVLGQTWHANVDLTTTGHSFAIVFASLAPAQLQVSPGLTLLLGAPLVEFLPIAPGPLVAYSLPLPAAPSLGGFQVSTQALHFGGVPTLLFANALDLTLGF